jgi:hypothetical protein
MTETLYALLAVGFGVILTVVFLGLGLWIGYQLGRAATLPANRALSLQIERLYREVAFCERLSGFAAVQAQELFAWAQQSTLLPVNMTETLQQLLATSQSISHRLQKAGTNAKAPSSKARAVPIESRLASAGQSVQANVSDLSTKELGQFTETAQHHVQSDSEADRRRYPYDCLQRLLEWEDPDGPLPSIADTVVVRCHDISSQGVSFFWPDDPCFKHLLISLGNDDDMVFMAAEIVHSKPVYMHGEWQYVVSCRFMKRMREFTEEWKQKSPDLQASLSG